MQIPAQIIKIHSLNERELHQSGKQGNEENVKIFIVKPLLDALGYNKPSRINYEHKIDLKRVDIALLVNKKPVVLVEVKQSNAKLKNHLEQAINYSNSCQCPYTLLTNGEEFQLYRTFIPNVIYPKDRLIHTFKRANLLDEWYKLFELISYENLAQGALKTYADKKAIEIRDMVLPVTLSDHLRNAKLLLVPAYEANIKERIAKSRSFLLKYNKWKKDNNLLKIKENKILNKLARMAAYNLVTKIYFCRILEDKKKIKKRLGKIASQKSIQQGEIRDILRASFAAVLEIDYRAIFEIEIFDSIFPNDEKLVINTIINLKEYRFDEVDQDVLGRIYEQHIDKDEKRDLGQYYTPAWIIKYIFDHIPLDTRHIILDPACGSGGFLIEAYNRLFQKYKAETYSDAEAHANILDHNLFGFDINSFAVMLSAANLALRNIDIPTDDINTFELDSLKYDVGHYLLGMKKQNTDESFISEKIHLEIPKAFDLIVGNPPYFVVKNEVVRKKYISTFGPYKKVIETKTNIVSLFIAKYLLSLKTGGCLAFVVPKALLSLKNWINSRKFILKHSQIMRIFDIREAFEDVKLEMIVLILKRTNSKWSPDDISVKVDYLKKVSSRKYNLEKIHSNEIPYAEFTEDIFPIYKDEINKNIFDKMNTDSKKLGHISFSRRGAPIQPHKNLWLKKKQKSSSISILRGRDVQNYYFTPIYWIDQTYPVFDKYKSYFEHRKMPKIMVQRLISQTHDHIKIIANYDPGVYLPIDTVVYFLIQDVAFNPLYILALLNSRLCAYYIYNFIFNRATRGMNFSYAKDLPIKIIPKKLQEEIANKAQLLINHLKTINKLEQEYNDITDLDASKIEAKKHIRDLRKEMSIAQKEIDKAVFDIYGLDEDEIRKVKTQK